MTVTSSQGPRPTAPPNAASSAAISRSRPPSRAADGATERGVAAPAPREPGVEAWGVAGRVPGHARRAPRGRRPRLAFPPVRAEGPGGPRPAKEPVRRLADEDLARRGDLLEAR